MKEGGMMRSEERVASDRKISTIEGSKEMGEARKKTWWPLMEAEEEAEEAEAEEAEAEEEEE